MTFGFVLPTVAALVASAAIWAASRRLRPSTAARFLTAAIVTGSAAAVAAMTAVGVAYLSEVPRLARAIGWCQAVVSHHQRVPSELGLPAVILFVAMPLAGARVVRRRRRATACNRSDGGVEILASDQLLAYAVPGRPGHVVVSVGMIRRLDADERRVLLAHEQAHLTHHHDRFLAIAEVATATMPLLRPLLARLRFATERWADEVAASEVGDRRLVARAIASAALAGQPADAALAFAGNGVVARVEALLDDRRPGPMSVAALTALLASALIAGMTSSGIQLHHFATLLYQLCR